MSATAPQPGVGCGVFFLDKPGGGPSAFAKSNPLQRFWRDLSLGTRHTALQTRLSLELYGRAIVGKPSNIGLLQDISRG